MVLSIQCASLCIGKPYVCGLTLTTKERNDLTKELVIQSRAAANLWLSEKFGVFDAHKMHGYMGRIKEIIDLLDGKETCPDNNTQLPKK